MFGDGFSGACEFGTAGELLLSGVNLSGDTDAITVVTITFVADSDLEQDVPLVLEVFELGNDGGQMLSGFQVENGQLNPLTPTAILLSDSMVSNSISTLLSVLVLLIAVLLMGLVYKRVVK